MSRDKLTTPLRKEFDPVQEKLAGRDTSALSGGDAGSRAIGNYQFQSHRFNDLAATAGEPYIAETAREDARGRCSAREDSILGILVENKLGRLWIGYAHPIGMRHGRVRIELRRGNTNPGMGRRS